MVGEPFNLYSSVLAVWRNIFRSCSESFTGLHKYLSYKVICDSRHRNQRRFEHVPDCYEHKRICHAENSFFKDLSQARQRCGSRLEFTHSSQQGHGEKHICIYLRLSPWIPSCSRTQAVGYL